MRRRLNIAIGTFLLILILLLFSHFENSQEIAPSEHYSDKWQDSSKGKGGEGTLAPAADAPIAPAFPDSEIPLSDAADAPAFPPPDGNSEGAFHADFQFQEDLPLDLPYDTLRQFALNKAHNWGNDGPKKYAYATFMSGRNPSLKDPYYLAIHSLIYRILWSPKSRTKDYPFIVYTADYVTPEQRALLTGAGAVVRDLPPLAWEAAVPGAQERWKDLFAKLNLWKETEFERITFLDADAFPMTNVDEMFELAPLQNCKEDKLQHDDFLIDGKSACEPYIFAGIPQGFTEPNDAKINGGVLVFTPSERMHQRLVQNYVKTDRYNNMFAEQGFLGWQFAPESAFPATNLERKWGTTFPKDEDEGNVNVLHEKIWVEKGWMREDWDKTWIEMCEVYLSEEWADARRLDGNIL